MPCDEFEKLLLQHQKQIGTVQDDTARIADQQKPMLLLADGDVRYCQAMRGILSQQYQVQCVSDGQSVLTCLDTYASQIRLIILSLDLKEPAGIEVLQKLQHRIEVRDVPIIATGCWDEQVEETALNIGADDFAGKPHTPMSLWKRVQRTQSLNVLRRQEQLLREEANRDDLTGLLNRRGLYAVCQSLRQDDAPLALFLFDLDNLKKVNNQLGRDQGDQRICQFSRLLRSHFRQSDISARLGQDEFIVIMKKAALKEAVLKKGRDLSQAFIEVKWNQDVPLTVSAGIAMWDLSETLDEMLVRADSALKWAKSGCQNRCCLWEEANLWGIGNKHVKM
ncbi:MAG: diguanylate cyclase [Holdemania massiliensis]